MKLCLSREKVIKFDKVKRVDAHEVSKDMLRHIQYNSDKHSRLLESLSLSGKDEDRALYLSDKYDKNTIVLVYNSSNSLDKAFDSIMDRDELTMNNVELVFYIHK